jgi:hypothetical protein
MFSVFEEVKSISYFREGRREGIAVLSFCTNCVSLSYLTKRGLKIIAPPEVAQPGVLICAESFLSCQVVIYVGANQ